MMKRFGMLVIGSMVLLALGCASVNPSKGTDSSTGAKSISDYTDSKNPGSKANEPKVTGPGDWNFVGTQEYLYRGNIVDMNLDNGELKSLTLKVAESINMEGQHAGNFGAVDDLTVEVVFEEPMAKAGQLESRLNKGGEIVVVVGQYVKPSSAKAFLGAKFDRTYYRVQDKYFNLNGEQVDIHQAPRAY